MVSGWQNKISLKNLIDEKCAALFVIALIGICNPAALSAAEQDSCVAITTEVKEGFTCDKPSPGFWSWKSFLFGGGVQAYSTFVENGCDQAIQISLAVPSRAVDAYSYAKAAAHERAELIGCGRPDKLLGWCFEHETVDYRCPENLLRMFPE